MPKPDAETPHQSRGKAPLYVSVPFEWYRMLLESHFTLHPPTSQRARMDSGVENAHAPDPHQSAVPRTMEDFGGLDYLESLPGMRKMPRSDRPPAPEPSNSKSPLPTGGGRV